MEAIFEATARILQSQGREGLNTNAIAERAGVSIGTLYGYFPSKQAIVLAMARRELDAVRDRVIASLTDASSPEPDPIRRAVSALIAGYNTRGRARRVLMETLFAHGGSEEMARVAHDVALVLAGQGASLVPGGIALSPMGLFVLTRSIDAVIRIATYEGVAFLTSRAFEDELVRWIHAYITSAHPSTPGRTPLA